MWVKDTFAHSLFISNPHSYRLMAGAMHPSLLSAWAGSLGCLQRIAINLIAPKIAVNLIPQNFAAPGGVQATRVEKE